MPRIPVGPQARLRAIDQAMGVAFRPVQGVCDEGPAPNSLASIELQVQQAFPFRPSLAAATQPVFGEGNPNADVVFIGEAPGADEDRTGRPFVGAAGQKLDQIISAMGLAREDVYICNILKARPPRNRAPLADEIAVNSPFLIDQLRCIRPSVIVALGGPAAKFLLDTDLGITRLRGRWGTWSSPAGDCQCAVMPTFHPAYLLRQYTPEVRGQMWQDMQQVMERLSGQLGQGPKKT